MSHICWTPDEPFVENTRMNAFIAQVNETHGLNLAHSDDLHDWSINNIADFWSMIWQHGDVIGDRDGDQSAYLPSDDAFYKAKFFDGATLNYAENLLKPRHDGPAIIGRYENNQRTEISWHGLYEQVNLCATAMRQAGVEKGDRVAAYMPNLPQTIIAFLAASTIGAVFSSASPDFGVDGVMDRFGQIEPSLLIAGGGYFYKGKYHNRLSAVAELSDKMGDSLHHTIIVDYPGQPAGDLEGNMTSWNDFMNVTPPSAQIDFAKLPFDHPLYILFSSGTTGSPKCILHRAGGALVQHIKELGLHCDVDESDRLFYFTTCGWMMWNWLVSGLSVGATVMLYDGNPFYPDGHALLDFTEEEEITVFGTSAKYIDALKTQNYRPIQTHGLTSVRLILSTGSPLTPELFDFVYDEVKSDVQLASISGGTDIVSSFVLGDPTKPVYRGEIQSAGLGMDVDVFDESGRPCPPGQPGELVCKQPFPSMPIGFWNDGADIRYEKAYFNTYDNIWHHGDWIEKTDHNGFIIHGRSDATLNPGGVRLGTAEIYRQLDGIDAVVDAAAVGQQWENDERIILFVVLRDNRSLDDELAGQIKSAIRSGASPRHVPSKILAVDDLPRTKSGKTSEITIRRVIHGKAPGNISSLANPECLDEFKDLPELQA